MGKRQRFVQPDVVRIELSDGDWIRVKKELTVREERRAFQAIIGEVKDGWRRPNVELIGIAEVQAYLVDWSFTDAKDNRVPVSIDALGDLDKETFSEIEAALKTHVEQMDVERAARKNGQGTSSDSGATS